MPDATLQFTISNDFPSGKCNPSTLEDEILVAEGIETALRHVNTAGDLVFLTFKATPNAATITALTGDQSGPCAGLIGAHQGNPPPAPPVDDRGAPIFAPTFGDARGHDPEWQGHRYLPQASDGASPLLSVWDQVITVEKEIISGSYRIIPPTAGEVPGEDIIEFSVVDKDDVLGYFAALNFEVGVDFLELKKWVRDEHVDGNARNERVFGGNEVFRILPGLYMRTAYTSTGTAVPAILITIKDYME